MDPTQLLRRAKRGAAADAAAQAEFNEKRSVDFRTCIYFVDI